MMKKSIWLVWLTVIGFSLDRVLKFLAAHGATLGSSQGVVHFELLPNPAIAFSIAFPNTLALIVIPIVVIGFIWFGIRTFRQKNYQRALAVTLVVVASMSNYLDRVQYGYVIDYVNLGRWFPVFNLSDVMIVIGLVMMLLPTVDRKKQSA